MMKFLIVLVLLLQHFFNEYIFFYLLILLFTLSIISIIYTLFVYKKISTDFNFDVFYYHCGENITINCKAISNYNFPNFRGTLILYNQQLKKNLYFKEVLFSVDNLEVERSYTFDVAGDYLVKLENIEIYDYFNIIKRKIKNPTVRNLRIYPIPSQIKKDELKTEDYYCEDPKFMKGDDYSEVYDYHEYRDGEKLQYIHYGLSAKFDEYIVKEGSSNLDPIYIFVWVPEHKFKDALIQLKKIYALYLIMQERHKDFMIKKNGLNIIIHSHFELYHFFDEIYEEFNYEETI
ncbi:MAG: hypothetical protein RSF69_06050 [Erysipelotrichaceae bacterium]